MGFIERAAYAILLTTIQKINTLSIVRTIMQFKLNAANARKSRRKVLPILAAVLLLAGLGGVFAYMQTRESKDPEQTQQATEADRSVGDVPTYEAETEGRTIEVPNNVDPGSIKDYELVTENEQFKIRKLGEEYVITLYAIINNPNQADMYREQLKEYKQNALQYLTQQGINTNNIPIKYEPDEARTL